LRRKISEKVYNFNNNENERGIEKMWTLEKEFNIAIGHRLMKNLNLCQNIHGHGFRILIGIKAEKLNKDDMVIDFSDVKKMITPLLDEWDHATILNENDEKVLWDLESHSFKIVRVKGDPTSENLCKILYEKINERFEEIKIQNNFYINFELDYVTIYETPTSKMTYKG